MTELSEYKAVINQKLEEMKDKAAFLLERGWEIDDFTIHLSRCGSEAFPPIKRTLNCDIGLVKGDDTCTIYINNNTELK